MTRPAAPPPSPADNPWAFARELSPRPVVRVADVDSATGRARNAYGSELPLAGPAPGRPYAVYLTDRRGRFRLLGFDLDAGKGPVGADLVRLCALLDRARLPHVVCASGPTGGRHVWVALARPAPADEVARLARALARMLPSLDIAPLSNPRTGALRPPGAPHRITGTSRVVAGRPAALLAPTATSDQLRTLAGLAEQAAPPTAAIAARALGRDADGRAHLLGERRPLPRAARNALDTPLRADDDASAVLACVLVGAARAGWRFEDVAALLDTAPGLEHARSERAGAGRSRRSRDSALRLLLRQWERACAYLAAAAPTEGAIDEEDWQRRLTAVVERVAALQARAEASPGRWAQPGGPADRRVLDQLCQLCLEAVQPAVEVDIRRLGMRCGISRETARVALHRLAADGWTARLAAAAGVRAATWALPDPPAVLSTGEVAQGLSQAAPPRLRTWSDLEAWRSHFSSRRATTAHDAFTPGGLGHHAARAYQMITTRPAMIANASRSADDGSGSPRHLADALGYPLAYTLHLLDRLAAAGLAQCDPRGRWRPGRTTPDRAALDRAATRLGVAGILDQRAARYSLEREAWAWWCDELAWRVLPRDAKRRRRDPEPGQIVLELREVPGLITRRRRGAHPTRPGGRADFAAALALLRRETADISRAAA